MGGGVGTQKKKKVKNLNLDVRNTFGAHLRMHTFVSIFLERSCDHFTHLGAPNPPQIAKEREREKESRERVRANE